ncbi:DUF1330 domain-containing protein [Rosenbergiella epipactidis]|uniref:DUF1330 domain-containing protein n=1 Tax=Rosenbergiella epipactidis TaxID=1544694 RepID=UPI001F4DF3CB|nr:DUF1330 domain-containing protein [Rosenbergiella epipactidis]
MLSDKPAYFVFDAKIEDPKALNPYLEKVEETYKAFGGEMLVQGGELEVIEGNEPKGKLVILKFDSMQTAKKWYQSEAYQAIIHHRHAGSRADGWLVEGLC